MYRTGTDNAETIDMRGWAAPVYPVTGHGANALGGNDTVHGSAYNDTIQGDTVMTLCGATTATMH